MKLKMKPLLPILFIFISAPCLAQGWGAPAYTYGSTDYEHGSLAYRRAKAEARTAAKREAEKTRWAVIALKHPPLEPEQVAAAKLRIAYYFLMQGRFDVGDRWMAEVADKFPTTDSGKKAKLELNR